jgi:DNA helicase-2/ATP-dependent DNA helicase PcrA
MELDQIRRDILGAKGHVLILGGPGCGKTTIALHKARQAVDDLQLEQRILFLSFSRAAVRQISERMRTILDHAGRERLYVRTFHAFFLELVRGHSRLTTGRPASFIVPDQARLLKAQFPGDWAAERERLAREEGRFTFELLAATAAHLLESSAALRDLYSSTYPLIIIDEFQDTNTDQWQALRALSAGSHLVCLADPDQRIYDFLEGVDDKRVAQATEDLSPAVFDLSGDNHRSPESGILDFANAVLRNDGPLTTARNVGVLSYGLGESCEAKVHQVIGPLIAMLEARLGRAPTTAVLTPDNALAAAVSERISVEARLGTATLAPVEHDLLWDPLLVAAAANVVASILQWPTMEHVEAVATTMRAIIDYYRTKSSEGAVTARDTADKLRRALTAFETGSTLRSNTCKALIRAVEAKIDLTGDPVEDWRTARTILEATPELKDVFTKARLLRMFHATDALGWSLFDIWNGAGYVDAAQTVRRVLSTEMLDAAEQSPSPVTLMTMHKSKGKEFDAVIIAEGPFRARLLDPTWDHDRDQAARRLLRVAITRAREFVILIRPTNCAPLFTPR